MGSDVYTQVFPASKNCGNRRLIFSSVVGILLCTQYLLCRLHVQINVTNKTTSIIKVDYPREAAGYHFSPCLRDKYLYGIYIVVVIVLPRDNNSGSVFVNRFNYHIYLIVNKLFIVTFVKLK